jgi:hypothetical protein
LLWCVVAFCAGTLGAAHAAEPLAGAVAAPVSPGFASVWRIHGEVTAAVEGGPTHALKAGDAVKVGERVTAKDNAEALLKTADGGAIAVRPGASFVVERFVAEGGVSDHATFRLLEGGLRLVTGWVGHINPRDYKVITPTATIGIRGTDHEPYVVTVALVPRLSQGAGTYDKVNRGGTTLEANGNSLDIVPGKVGFARLVNPIKTRALMTLVLPVILDKVPDFYVPGQFDAELDALSATAEATSQAQLEARRAPSVCNPNAAARSWLAQLDDAVAQQDGEGILRMFSPTIEVQATVRDRAGQYSTLRLGREDFARSVVTAVRSLQNYRHRRPVTQASSQGSGDCRRLLVHSLVIEQGNQGGTAYRFESTEDYVLERQEDLWIAVEAKTIQR